jgi:peptide-methionine (S)-S-oxide reductase
MVTFQRDRKAVDALFQEAVSAIDAGDLASLARLLNEHPRLVRERLRAPGDWLRDTIGPALRNFFRDPYLLWFVAEDPKRNGTLPKNVRAVTRTIVQAAQREGVPTLQEQLDYALKLVAWSGVAADCGVQLDLIDELVDAGASPVGVPDAALVNGHVEAAARLVERGAPLTLSSALGLKRLDEAEQLAKSATAREKQGAFVLAALNGNAEALKLMIDLGVDINDPSPDLYAHATPLHHAVCSGSLEAVKVLVEAGAGLHTKDKAEHATPLGWAEYYQGNVATEERVKRYAAIAAYLRGREG